MRRTTRDFETAARVAVGRARAAGQKAGERLLENADAALVYAGDMARQRQRRRAVRTALKVVGRAALVAGTAAVAVVAVRAVRGRKRLA